MRTDIVTLKSGKESVAKALRLADEVAAERKLNSQNTRILEMLTEETLSLEYSILGIYAGDIFFEIDRNRYELVLLAEVEIDENTKDTFIRMSKSGKNDLHTSIAEKLLQIVKDFGSGSDISRVYDEEEAEDYTVFYTDDGEVWNETEKSILHHYADDVRVGIKNGKIQIKVIKEF